MMRWSAGIAAGGDVMAQGSSPTGPVAASGQYGVEIQHSAYAASPKLPAAPSARPADAACRLDLASSASGANSGDGDGPQQRRGRGLGSADKCARRGRSLFRRAHSPEHWGRTACEELWTTVD
eukprot:8120677-Pyramimonas_sp.AAC.1